MKMSFKYHPEFDIESMVKALENLNPCKVTSITISGDVITFETSPKQPDKTDDELFEDIGNLRRELMRGSECKMCGGDWSLNDEGYCSRCWQVWNS